MSKTGETEAKAGEPVDRSELLKKARAARDSGPKAAAKRKTMDEEED
jgi:hypothetical protein